MLMEMIELPKKLVLKISINVNDDDGGVVRDAEATRFSMKNRIE